jgi:hypothetical protein
MPRKPIELPPAVARRFVEDTRAFHAEPNAIKADEIAARQLHALKQHYSGKLRSHPALRQIWATRLTRPSSCPPGFAASGSIR